MGSTSEKGSGSSEKRSGSKALASLEAALRTKYPGLHRKLAPGASVAAIERLEKQASVPLPPTFRELYLLHDGGKGGEEEFYGVYSFLSIADMLAQRAMMNGLLAKRPDWRKSGFWNARWFPFLDDFSGNFICLDLAGAFGGEPGQLIGFDHETGPVVTFARIEALIETMLALAGKKILRTEDLEAAGKIYKKKNPGFPHTGDPNAKALEDELNRLANQSKYKQLLARVDEALASKPDDAELWNWKWNSLRARSRDEEALEAMDRELELLRPTRAHNTYLRKAETLIDLGRVEEAEVVLVLFVRRKPAPPHEREGALTAYDAIFEAHFKKGRRAEAARVFKAWENARSTLYGTYPKRFNQGEFNYVAWSAYAQCLAGKARKTAFESARAGAERRLKLEAGEQEIGELHNFLAYFCQELGDLAAAFRHLTKAVGIDPTYVAKARRDPDFKPLVADPRFAERWGGRAPRSATPTGKSGARRGTKKAVKKVVKRATKKVGNTGVEL